MFYNILLILLCPIISIAGLAAAPIYLIYLTTCLFYINKNELIHNNYFNSSIAKAFVAFSILALLSIGLSFQPLAALQSWFIIWPLILSFFIIKKFDLFTSKHIKYLITGLVLSILLTLFEIYSKGMISAYCHQHFFKPTHIWFLHDLNRGMTFLALAIWPAMLGILNHKLNFKRLLLSVLLYLTIYILVANSESLSAETALIFSAAIALLIYKFPSLSKAYYWLFMLSIPLIIIIFIMMDPVQLTEQFKFLPLSAIHRLHIWHHCAERLIEFPLGVGFNGTRFIPIEAMENHPTWGPLIPLHTHNHLLQIAVECGIIGIFAIMYLYHMIIKQILKFNNKLVLSLALGMLTCHYIISLISYGMWQQWWLASTILTVSWFNKLSIQPSQTS